MTLKSKAIAKRIVNFFEDQGLMYDPETRERVISKIARVIADEYERTE